MQREKKKDIMKNLKETQNNLLESFCKLSPNTQRARNFINSYVSATATHLRDVYNSYSDEKAQGFKYCTDLFSALNGERFRVISASKFIFTVAFMVNNGKDLVIITALNTYLIKGAFNNEF